MRWLKGPCGTCGRVVGVGDVFGRIGRGVKTYKIVRAAYVWVDTESDLCLRPSEGGRTAAPYLLNRPMFYDFAHRTPSTDLLALQTHAGMLRSPQIMVSATVTWDPRDSSSVGSFNTAYLPYPRGWLRHTRQPGSLPKPQRSRTMIPRCDNDR